MREDHDLVFGSDYNMLIQRSSASLCEQSADDTLLTYLNWHQSTNATSQLPIDEWHGLIGDLTLADAIVDRLVHNAYKINLRGESMRKRKAKLTGTPPAK